MATSIYFYTTVGQPSQYIPNETLWLLHRRSNWLSRMSMSHRSSRRRWSSSKKTNKQMTQPNNGHCPRDATNNYAGSFYSFSIPALWQTPRDLLMEPALHITHWRFIPNLKQKHLSLGRPPLLPSYNSCLGQKCRGHGVPIGLLEV
jgi:hypothetical protein